MGERRKRGTSAIRQLDTRTWEARISLGFDAKGKRVRKTLYAKSKSELERAVERERLRAQRGNVDGQKIILDDYLAGWLSDVRATCAASTYRLREMVVRLHISPHLGRLRLGAIRPSHIRGLLATLQTLGVGARTCALAHTTLGCAFNAAVKDEMIERSPVALVAAPRAQKKAKRILSLDEARTLLAAAHDNPLRAIYYLALTTGMRQGEILALTWSDVDLDAAVLSVKATLTRDLAGKLVRSSPKTESSRRAVHLPAMTVEALRRHRKGQANPFGLVFTDAAGGPIRKDNFTRRSFQPLLPRAGLPRVTFHSLRHAANSILLAQGESVLTLAERLGHSSTRMTLDTYSHLQPQAHREAAGKIDAAFAEIGQVRPNDVAS